MSELPQSLTVADTVFSRVETPEDLACWSADVPGREDASVSLLIEPAALPSEAVTESAEGILADFAELEAAALAHLGEALRDDAYALSEADLARLGVEPAPFGYPEAVIWADGTWMLHFAESALEIAEPYGIGVTFVGRAPHEIELLADAEEL